MKRRRWVFPSILSALAALLWLAAHGHHASVLAATDNEAAATADMRPGLDFAAVFAAAGGGPISPCRSIVDPYPAFNSVAVDPQNHIAVISDNALKSALVYDINAGESPNKTAITPYLYQVRGYATHIASPAGVTVDPVAKRFYVADNDIGESIGTFPYGARGNYPAQSVAVPVGAYGIGISQTYHQFAVSEEDQPLIMFFRIGANGADHPLREIRGPHTQMADPRGLVWDDGNHEILIANQGAWNRGYWDRDWNGGGHYQPPSLEAFSDVGKGDVKPLRVIQGSRTQLNWPFQIALDPVHNEIAVANLGGNSVLVFKRTAQGNVAPVRVIKGPHTGLMYPIGVAYDTVHNQLWVVNYGHEALIYDRSASGDATPVRVIRSAPAGTATVGISNPFTMAYDSRRDELLVRN
jgi:DNA-binding beta-propeller fold protein YncE